MISNVGAAFNRDSEVISRNILVEMNKEDRIDLVMRSHGKELRRIVFCVHRI